MPSKEKVGTTGDTSVITLYKNYVETSTNTVDFFAKKARGEELPVRTYHFSNISWSGATGIMCNPWAQNAYHGWYRPMDMLNGSQPWSEQKQPKPGTLTKYRQAVENELFEEALSFNIDSLTFAKELPQTVRMLSKLYGEAVDLYRAVTRRRPQDLKDIILWGRQDMSRAQAEKRFARNGYREIAKATADRWLEASFGVKPLVEDAVNAVGILDQALVPADRILYAKAGRSFYDPYLSQTIPTSSTWRYRGGSMKTMIRAEMLYEVANPWAVLAQQLGLDVPLASVWECIPFSFVLDWFVNVGDWLKSGRSLNGCNVKRSWRSEKFQTNGVTVSRNCSRTTTGSEKQIQKYRASISAPTFRSTPTWDPSLTVGQYTSALALGIQRLL